MNGELSIGFCDVPHDLRNMCLALRCLKFSAFGPPPTFFVLELLGSLSNHDGNAKENVTLKMTSKYFKLLGDSDNSSKLCNVAEQSGS